MSTKTNPIRSSKTVLATAAEHTFPPNACVHIDKIHFSGPLTHKPRGTVNFTYDEELGLIPSHTYRNELKSGKKNEVVFIHSRDIDEDGAAHKLEIHCCPPKVLQQHNLFGHASVVDYVNAVFDVVLKLLGLDIKTDVDPHELKEWRDGAVWITVIHLTCNFKCSKHHVLPIIDAIDQNNRSGKHRDYLTCISLGYTPEGRSHHHALTIYYKPAQLENEWSGKGNYQNKLLEYVENSIRAEVKIFSMGLKAHDLRYGANWNNVNVAALFFEIFNKFDIKYAIQPKLTEREIQQLDIAETNAYLLWLSGRSLVDQFKSRSSACKYITLIEEKTGVNTGQNRRPEELPPVHLADVFRADNALAIPDWLFGTPYYFPAAQQSVTNPTGRRLTKSSVSTGSAGIGSAPLQQGRLPDRIVLINGQSVLI